MSEQADALQRMDWSWLEAFQSVAEHGSLSAAARASGLSQPTLSRHIAALEKSLGVTLFDRTSQGLLLAPAGLGLVEHANAMVLAANRFALHAKGHAQSIEGTVRITASNIVATYQLPQLIAKLQEQEPAIQIEVVSSDKTGNLLRREADIAIRMYKPTQQDVIVKKLGTMNVGLFASRSYIKKHGVPEKIEDFKAHKLIGYDTTNDVMIDGYKKAGVLLHTIDFSIRCDDQVVTWELCRAGCGIGVMQQQIGLSCKDVIPLFDKQAVATMSVWLTAHAELRTSARISRVYEFISEHFIVD